MNSSLLLEVNYRQSDPGKTNSASQLMSDWTKIGGTTVYRVGVPLPGYRIQLSSMSSREHVYSVLFLITAKLKPSREPKES